MISSAFFTRLLCPPPLISGLKKSCVSPITNISQKSCYVSTLQCSTVVALLFQRDHRRNDCYCSSNNRYRD